MRTLPRLSLIVTASVVVAVAGLWLVHSFVPPAVLEPNNKVCGNYLQTVGTIYAVLLTFVVFVVWFQENEAWHLVERQADVLRVARLLGEPVRSRVVEAARAYVREVIGHECGLMACGKASPRAGNLLEELWFAMATAEPPTPREEALYAQAADRFNEFSDARTDLLQNSRIRLPPTMWILLVTGGMSTAASMYFFGLDDFWCLALMTAGLAGAVSFVLFLICDLDYAFSGTWHVTPDPLRRSLDQIEKQ
jgi:hypothetical protein